MSNKTTRPGAIWYDCTKSAKATHRSGLQRVAHKLLEELGGAARPIQGVDWVQQAGSEDWFLTAEVFAPSERPGFSEVLANRPCRMAAVFYDAIPLKQPHITWPASVARHPAYMKMLASFDLVLAISEASRRELLDYWAWLGLARVPRVEAIRLGSNFDASPRVLPKPERTAGPPLLLCVGIIEPRKNQEFLLRVCESLWGSQSRLSGESLVGDSSLGAGFELHVIGRVNPHFGKPIVERMRRGRRPFYFAGRCEAHCRSLAARPQRKALGGGRVYYHEHLSDEGLAGLYERVSVTVFPTIAEGCGLPVLESLWRGVPCLCSDIPAIRENADEGGALLLPPNDGEAWARAIREVVETGSPLLARLRSEVAVRSLPTWADTAQQVLGYLGL